MRLTRILEIHSQAKIKEFLDTEHVGRISSIDADGFPQVIPMNFVMLGDVIYMHSHTRGEKLDNIARNNKVGFEVDREIEFLPSYFSDPDDASLADTLYISIVVKGTGSIVADMQEKTRALNGLMLKYQPEGGYKPIRTDMQKVLDSVAVIKVVPQTLRGKYKIGQHMSPEDRIELAKQILKRNSPSSLQTLKIMGFEVTDDGIREIDGTHGNAW